MQQENNKENNSFQDIIPQKHHSIRDIPIPDSRRKKHEVEDIQPVTHRRTARKEVIEETEEEEVEIPVPTPRKSRNRYNNIPDGHFSEMGNSKVPKFIVPIALILVVALGFFTLFSKAGGAKLKITPQQEKATIDATLTAKKDATGNDLQFETLTLSKDASASVDAVATEQDVVRKAAGTIIVYNDYTTANQTLIANTRFQTANGLIYRIPTQIVVPGQKKVDGKTVPGSVEVKVVADQPGENYNVQSADFTIPGFKGDPRYAKFTAKTKEPITGGFVGKEKSVSPETQQATETQLQAKLKDDLIKEVRAQLPTNLIMYENGIMVTYQSLPATTGTDGKTQVNERATLSAVAFDRDQLATAVAQTKNSVDPTTFAGIENLSFDLQNKEAFNASSTTDISFKVNGDGKLVWKYDQAKLLQDLAGKNKNQVNAVLANYPTIKAADVVLKPFWTRTLPEKVDKISIQDIIGE